MTRDLSSLHGKVSYHAVTRFIQRVLRIAVPHDAGLSPQQIAELHCVEARSTIEHIKSLILTPAVAMASLSRLSHIGTRDFVAKLNPLNGTITTIIVVEPIRKNKVPCALTKTESGRFRRREAKRNKWRVPRSNNNQYENTPKVETGVQRTNK